MRSNLFYLDDEQGGRIEPQLPSDVRGKEWVEARWVISGILRSPACHRVYTECEKFINDETVLLSPGAAFVMAVTDD